MNFTENSGLVKTWVNLVKGGTYTREQIPNLFNLREVVTGVLDAAETAYGRRQRAPETAGKPRGIYFILRGLFVPKWGK